MNNQYQYLNHYFSKKKIIEIMKNNKNNCFERIIEEISTNYENLSKNYRNEYFYKNTLFNKMVLGKYSLNTSAAFSEVRIGKSKADFIIINHLKGMVFEIKTDLDNLERLSYQLEDYYKAFSEVYVLTSEDNYYPVYKLVKELHANVGIYILNKHGRLSLKKSAVQDNTKLEYDALFKLLRKSEYENIIKKYFGSVPKVKPVEYYKACLKLFKTIDLLEIQKNTFFELKRRKSAIGVEMINKTPFQIRWLVYQMDLNVEKYKKLSDI
ncbi:sce7726 family protein [Rummeliibacillus pycnus]|uniref:sce7726 family protein n=1 Tax=Rummeliibacillus pycnus TaxID=101070 RepID=UPI0037CAF8E9